MLNFISFLTLALFTISPVMANIKLEPSDPSYQFLFYQVIDANQQVVSLEEQIDALSQVFVGAPYVAGSLGEGEQGKYDKDPLVRFGEFDCTTYVETILAGAMSQSVGDFMPNLMSLRYKDGNVAFTARNHFPSLDWVPNNQDKLEDITKTVAHGSLMTAKTTIDKAPWYQKMEKKNLHCDDDSSTYCDVLLVQFHKEGDVFSPEIATIDYVPITALYSMAENFDAEGLNAKNSDKEKEINRSLLDRIPSGSVITMVRPDWVLKKWIGTNMNVSHQGFAIRKDGQLFLRHASVLHQKVVDENFVDYFSHYSASSSLKGFNVQVLKDL
ncbi:hypothetical protein MUS1_12640 [Marinomonas ushuaiensis DSM 15871]|uniref:DUF1460 domain-containing protein n=1 Tax=Marinomonas ushuaiensis DSM 15871 TaxID=1122207 RepID=X7E6P0_9GAMM|nr:N-acetylmuramoyl-L-alanine amidase-like domain-containing protein [Marinomonas ushuaiensis]ETX10818.1 hypothetical protein MUS1_12640 [Marinomonas ushuaiensis DSM 15871]